MWIIQIVNHPVFFAGAMKELEAVSGIDHFRSVFSGVASRKARQHTGNRRVAVDHVIVAVINDFFDGFVRFHILLIKDAANKGDLKNLINKIQLKSRFQIHVVVRSNVDFTAVLMEHIHQRTMKLRNVT